jgi:hypothetical protein
VPDDADPEIIALEQHGIEPLSPEEFDEWVARSGNPYTSSKARVQDSFTDKKVSEWFDEQGGSVVYKAAIPDLITFDVFQACVAKHPPSIADIPVIPEGLAKIIITSFKTVIFIMPDAGMAIVDGVIVTNNGVGAPNVARGRYPRNMEGAQKSVIVIRSVYSLTGGSTKRHASLLHPSIHQSKVDKIHGFV